MKPYLRTLAALAVFLGLSSRSWALFGVGDIVFDPTAFFNLTEQYGELQSQYDELSSILGVAQQSAGYLNQVQQAIGQVKAGVNLNQAGINSLTSLTQGMGIDLSGSFSTNIGGLGISGNVMAGTGNGPGGSAPSTGNNLAKMFQTSGPFAGSLDVFMGMNLNSFQGTMSPVQNFLSWATNNSVNAMGVSVGLSDPEIGFSAQIALMPDSARAKNKTQIASAIADMHANSYMNNASARRVSMQTESNLAADAANDSSNAGTLNDLAAAGNKLAYSNARVAALNAQMTNDANETLLSQGSSMKTNLDSMEARRQREDAEARLAKKLQDAH